MVKKYLFVLTLLALAACARDDSDHVDAKKLLDSMNGPQVEGVEAMLLKSAVAAEESGNHTLAAQYYQQLVDKDPKKIAYKLGMAESVRKSANPAQSLPMYDALLAEKPDFVAAQEGKGLALMATGDVPGADRQLSAVVSSGKAGWRTYNALGILTASKGTPAAALPFFQEAQRLSPKNASVLNNVGLVQALNQHYGEAIATLTQASQAAEGKSQIKQQIELNTAMVYAAAGKLDNAETIARRYFDGPALANNMGFYAHVAKDDRLARTYLDMALTQSKTFYQRAWENRQIIAGTGALQDIPASNTSLSLEVPSATLPPVTLSPEAPKPTVAEAPAPAPALMPPAVSAVLDTPGAAPATTAAIATSTEPALAADNGPPPAMAVDPTPPTMGYLKVPAGAQPSLPAPAPTPPAVTLDTTPATQTPATESAATSAVSASEGTSAPTLAPAVGGIEASEKKVEKKPVNGFESIGHWLGDIF